MIMMNSDVVDQDYLLRVRDYMPEYYPRPRPKKIIHDEIDGELPIICWMVDI